MCAGHQAGELTAGRTGAETADSPDPVDRFRWGCSDGCGPKEAGALLAADCSPPIQAGRDGPASVATCGCSAAPGSGTVLGPCQGRPGMPVAAAGRPGCAAGRGMANMEAAMSDTLRPCCTAWLPEQQRGTAHVQGTRDQQPSCIPARLSRHPLAIGSELTQSTHCRHTPVCSTSRLRSAFWTRLIYLRCWSAARQGPHQPPCHSTGGGAGPPGQSWCDCLICAQTDRPVTGQHANQERRRQLTSLSMHCLKRSQTSALHACD